MRDYILTLSCISVFCGIIHILSPAGDGGGIKRNIRLITSLCVLCVALFPIGDFLIRLGEYEMDFWDEDFSAALEVEYEEEFLSAMLEYSDETVAELSAKMLLEKFDMQDGDISVVVFSCVENDNIKILRADIEIHPGGISQPPDPLKESLEELLGCECRIIYK